MTEHDQLIAQLREMEYLPRHYYLADEDYAVFEKAADVIAAFSDASTLAGRAAIDKFLNDGIAHFENHTNGDIGHWWIGRIKQVFSPDALTHALAIESKSHPSGSSHIEKTIAADFDWKKIKERDLG